ncbi:hypothetical protein FQN54_009327 [Arachnomyces sp. PD_36]|nr:hypothetical protein FQN54_009327 [Arachnomyces sp. PD_36]
MSKITLEVECQRRINAINAEISFCDVKEERLTRRSTQSRVRSILDDDDSYSLIKRQRHSMNDETEIEIVLRQAMKSVRIKFSEQRSQICFLCVENSIFT